VDEAEVGIPGQVLDISGMPCCEVINGDHLVSVRKEAIGQMRANKSGTTGNQDSATHFSPGPTVGRPIE
jgi:hypothetical protein